MATHELQPPEWIDGAPITVTETIDISAPPSDVWAQIADHESWPEWFAPIERVELLGAPTGVGGGRRIFVRKRPIDEVFTAWDVDRHFAFAVTDSKLPILHALAESVRLEPIDSGTRVTYRQGLAGRPGFGWLMRLIWKQPAQQLATALEQLRVRAEARG
ncbi:MAG: SRPBCC family protein [Ilumatobacteraceae bacterium]|nr:SRPBCC family protein [Ilumatobacteraceae bacterium]